LKTCNGGEDTTSIGRLQLM